MIFAFGCYLFRILGEKLYIRVYYKDEQSIIRKR